MNINEGCSILRADVVSGGGEKALFAVVYNKCFPTNC